MVEEALHIAIRAYCNGGETVTHDLGTWGGVEY